MGAIAYHLSQEGAVENVFAAGVDIALMPVSIHRLLMQVFCRTLSATL
ncbi:hypothetical protein [Erwinia aphidicola]